MWRPPYGSVIERCRSRYNLVPCDIEVTCGCPLVIRPGSERSLWYEASIEGQGFDYGVRGSLEKNRNNSFHYLATVFVPPSLIALVERKQYSCPQVILTFLQIHLNIAHHQIHIFQAPQYDETNEVSIGENRGNRCQDPLRCRRFGPRSAYTRWALRQGAHVPIGRGCSRRGALRFRQDAPGAHPHEYSRTEGAHRRCALRELALRKVGLAGSRVASGR